MCVCVKRECTSISMYVSGLRPGGTRVWFCVNWSNMVSLKMGCTMEEEGRCGEGEEGRGWRKEEGGEGVEEGRGRGGGGGRRRGGGGGRKREGRRWR